MDDFEVKHLGFKLYKVVNEYQVSYKAKGGLDGLDGMDGMDGRDGMDGMNGLGGLEESKEKEQLEKLGPYANDTQNTLNVENRFIMEPIEDDVLKDILISYVGPKNQIQSQNPKQEIRVWNILNWITWQFWDIGDFGAIGNFNKWLREYYIHNDIIHIELLMNKINELLYEIEPNYLTFYSFIDLWKYRRNQVGKIVLQIHFDDKVQLNREIQDKLMFYHLLFICHKRDIRYIRFI